MDTNKKYQQRIRQRHVMARIGKWSFVSGFILLIIGLIGQYYVIASIGQTSLYLGAISIVIFSRLGWSKSLWKDVLFNQLSIVVVFTGFGILFFYAAYGILLPKFGIFTVVTGLTLAILGMIFKSSLSE